MKCICKHPHPAMLHDERCLAKNAGLCRTEGCFNLSNSIWGWCDEHNPDWLAASGLCANCGADLGASGLCTRPECKIQDDNILHKADTLTSVDRPGAYGHPLDDFTCTAALMTAVLQKAGKLRDSAQLEPELAALLMQCVKVSRLAGNLTHTDSQVDGAGYYRVMQLIQDRRRGLWDEEVNRQSVKGEK